MKPLIAAALLLPLLIFVAGCSDDPVEPTTPPGFTVSASEVVVAPGGTVVVMMSGGTKPYGFISGLEWDTTFATVTMSGDSLIIHGVASGWTDFTVADAVTVPNGPRVSIAVSGPITVDLFPIVLGHQFTFDGHAITTTGVMLSDPSNVYNTNWLLAANGPLPASTVIVDSTTLQHPSAGVITVGRNLLIVKNPVTGEFYFAQTLGPFFRAFGIPRTDTVRVVSIAKPELGIGGTWVSFDSSYTSGSGSTVRLEINGVVEGGEAVTDSAATPSTWETIKFRTWRRISVNGAVVVDNATTSRIWLRYGVGPIQVLIAQDTENLGHFRTLKAKNF